MANSYQKTDDRTNQKVSQNSLLPNRLKLLRKEHKLTQLELSEQLGFSRGLIGNYEVGSRNPDYETLVAIANFFNVSIDYLLGTTNYRRLNVSDKLKEYSDILQNIEFLSDDGISDLRTYLYLLALRDRQNSLADNEKK